MSKGAIIAIVVVVILLLICGLVGYLIYDYESSSTTASVPASTTPSASAPTSYSAPTTSSSASTPAAALANVAAAATLTAAPTPSNQTTSANIPYASGFYEGQVIRNSTTGAISKLILGKYCLYPNLTVYAENGSPNYTNISATLYNAGDSPGPNFTGAGTWTTNPYSTTATYPSGLYEGEVVKGTPSGNISQLINGQICFYPNPTIYAANGTGPSTTVSDAILATIPPGPNFAGAGVWV